MEQEGRARNSTAEQPGTLCTVASSPTQLMNKSDYTISKSRESNVSSNVWNPNRFVLLVMFLFIGFLTGSFLYNWPPTQLLYLRSGAYSWLCSPKPEITSIGVDKRKANLNLLSDAEIFQAACAEQIQAIDSLMPSGVASMFFFAFIGGLCVDYLGPKTAGLIGISFQLIGWLLLIFCNQNVPLYPLANIFMGFGNDPMYIALLDCSNLFSNNRGIIIAVLSASRSLSLAFPSIFNLLLTTFPEEVTLRSIYVAYICILGFCFIAVIFIFPWRSFERETKPYHIENYIPDSLSRKVEWPFSTRVANKGKSFDAQSNASLPTRCGQSDLSFISSAPTVGSTSSISSNFRPSRALPSNPASLSEFGSSFTNTSFAMSLASNSSSSSKNVVVAESLASSSAVTRHSVATSRWSILSSGLYLPLLPIAATTILSGTFFANSSREQLGNALTMFIVLNPFSFLSGVFMGYLTDIYGPLFVMCIVNILSLLQFALLLFEDIIFILPFITAFVSFLVLSFFLTQFYCYIALTFPSKYFGTLSGFVVMCSGLLSLVVTPMCDFSSFASNYIPMNGLCLALTASNVIFLYAIYVKQGFFIKPSEQLHIPRADNSSDDYCVALQGPRELATSRYAYR